MMAARARGSPMSAPRSPTKPRVARRLHGGPPKGLAQSDPPPNAPKARRVASGLAPRPKSAPDGSLGQNMFYRSLGRQWTDLSPRKGPVSLRSVPSQRVVQAAPILVRFRARNGICVPDNTLLARVLTMIGANIGCPCRPCWEMKRELTTAMPTPPAAPMPITSPTMQIHLCMMRPVSAGQVLCARSRAQAGWF